MKRNIYFLFDLSGSFNECSKNHLQHYIMDSIVNAFETGTLKTDDQFKFYLWNEQISEFKYDPDSWVQFKGRSDFEVLSELNDNSLVFLFSDGNFSEDVIVFSQIINNKNIKFFPFEVGADSDIINLEHLSATRKVYKPENLISTISRLLLESVS